MASKILYKYSNSSGVTLLELVLSITIFIILVVSVVAYINPTETRSRGRDNKRLSDLSSLDRAINEYKLDTGSYPDVQDILRTSNTLLAKQNPDDQDQWINADLFAYISAMPVDPLNDATYFYSYLQDGVSYELNCTLEFLTTEMESDGGNDPSVYELGTNLSLISP